MTSESTSDAVLRPAMEVILIANITHFYVNTFHAHMASNIKFIALITLQLLFHSHKVKQTATKAIQCTHRMLMINLITAKATTKD